MGGSCSRASRQPGCKTSSMSSEMHKSMSFGRQAREKLRAWSNRHGSNWRDRTPTPASMAAWRVPSVDPVSRMNR